MKLAATVSLLQFGGPGSGCHGDNCGRPGDGIEDIPGEKKVNNSPSAYVSRVKGNTAQADALIARIDSLDKTGNLKAFLTKFPLAEVQVVLKPLRHAAIQRADGSYQRGSKKLAVRQQEDLTVNSPLFDREQTIGHQFPHDAATQQFVTFTHELGHHVWETLDKAVKDNTFRMETIRTYQDDKKPPSTYAKESYREYFSEAFASYLLGGKLSPAAKGLVKRTLDWAVKV